MSPSAAGADAGVRPGAGEGEGVEVIVVNYRGAADTLGALASLPWSELAAVHVVDNSVDVAQADCLREGLAQWPRASLHVASENLGFARACNLAWRHTRAEFVLLLNPDARLRAGALARLMQSLAESPRVAAVAPRIDWTEEGHLVLPNLTSQSPTSRIVQAAVCRAAPWAPRAFERRGACHAQRTMRLMSGAQAFDAPALSGAVLLLRRRAVWEAARGAGLLFDPAYFMFFEDTDLSRRLRKAGWRLAVEPRAGAWHAWHHRPDKAVLMAESERTYLQRHHALGDRLQRQLVPRLWADPWRAQAQAAQAVPGDSVVPVVRSAAECRASVGQILAITPLPMLHPAGVRADAVPRPVSDEEWTLLDPGRWYAWIGGGPGGAGARWCRFDVAAAA